MKLESKNLIYTGFQFCTKGILACLGWYNNLTLPETFDTYGQVKKVHMPYAFLSTSLFLICNCVDIHWHWGGDILTIAHHILSLFGTILCYMTPGFGINIISLTVILETVAPVYQILKLQNVSIHIKTQKNLLRIIATGVNFFIRIPYCFWLLNLLSIQINAHYGGFDPFFQISPCIWYLCMTNCFVCIILDLIWSTKMLLSTYANQVN